MKHSGPEPILRLETTMSKPLSEHLAEHLPNGEAVHGHGPDSFAVELADGHDLVITPEDDGYMLGLYESGAWPRGDGHVTYADIPDQATAITTIEVLTDGNPEGTDYLAWAQQWVDDQLDNATRDVL